MKNSFLFGVHSVGEWLEAGPDRIEAILVAPRQAPRVERLLRLAEELKIPIEQIANGKLRALAGPRNPQGIAARVKPFPFADLDDVVASCERPAVLLALDGVTDPGNVGAIIRSAAFFGVAGVLLPSDRSASMTPVVERSAAGALSRVPVCQVNNLVTALRQLQERDFWVLASILGPNPTPSELELSGSIVAVVGSEGRGIRPSIRKLCDYRTSLPACGQWKGASLNVANFTGILLYEIQKQQVKTIG